MFEMLWELPKYGSDTKWVNDVGKMVLIGLLSAELPQTFYLKNAVSAKCNKVLQDECVCRDLDTLTSVILS